MLFRSVAPGHTQLVTVAFMPVTSGAASDIVIFSSNGGISTNALVGTGLTPGQIGVSPVALDFGTLVTGTISQRVFTVNNAGGTDVTNGVATVGAPYSIISGATFDVPAGGSTNIVVRFAPVAVGAFTNDVIFDTDNGGRSTNSVTGSGAVVPSANFTATPTNGVVPFVVAFTDTATGTITNRFWNFGDGTTLNTNALSLTHSYDVAGDDADRNSHH